MGLLTAEQYAQPNRFTSGMDTAPTGAVNNPYLQDYLANYQGWQNQFALPPSTFDRYSFTEAEADPHRGFLAFRVDTLAMRTFMGRGAVITAGEMLRQMVTAVWAHQLVQRVATLA